MQAVEEENAGGKTANAFVQQKQAAAAVAAAAVSAESAISNICEKEQAGRQTGGCRRALAR